MPRRIASAGDVWADVRRGAQPLTQPIDRLKRLIRR
jgi:hypothetical protein